jgi:hypothetical protein
MFSHVGIINILFVITGIGYFTISETRKGKSEKELERIDKIDKMLREAFPITFIIFITLVLTTAFSLIAYLIDSNLSDSYVQSFLSTKSVITHAIGTALIAAVLLFFGLKEYHNVSNELHRERPYLLISIIYVIILGSLTTNVAIIPLLNRVLDYSKPIEETVKISRKIKHSQSKHPDTYHLSFEQQLYDINSLEVSRDEYNSINEGDNVKLKIYSGLFGLKYKSGSIQVIKEDNPSSN